MTAERKQRVLDAITPEPVQPEPSINLAVDRIIYLEDQTRQLTEQLHIERDQYKRAMREACSPRINVVRYGTREALQIMDCYRDLDSVVVVVR